MTKLCLWYHDSDSSDLSPDLEKRIESFGFKIEKPKNKLEFLNMMKQLDDVTIILHIFAHGDKDRIAPFTAIDIERMSQEEGRRINTDPFLIPYREIKLIVDSLINRGCELTINLMSVCDSYYAPINAKYFLSCQGKSQMTDGSLDVYRSKAEQYDDVINDLNSRKVNANGKFHLKTYG